MPEVLNFLVKIEVGVKLESQIGEVTNQLNRFMAKKKCSWRWFGLDHHSLCLGSVDLEAKFCRFVIML